VIVAGFGRIARTGYAGAVELRVVPEPPERIREALVAALADEPGPADGSAWWRAGLAEAVEEEPD
jgi:hypothetical protein